MKRTLARSVGKDLGISYWRTIMELNELQKERIRRGAALLDEKVPDWHTRVNLTILDVDSFTLCVVCQIFGNFYDGLDSLGLTKYTATDYDEVAVKAAAEHGFYPHKDESMDIMEMTDKDYREAETRARLKTAYWHEQVRTRSVAK